MLQIIYLSREEVANALETGICLSLLGESAAPDAPILGALAAWVDAEGSLLLGQIVSADVAVDAAGATSCFDGWMCSCPAVALC